MTLEAIPDSGTESPLRWDLGEVAHQGMEGTTDSSGTGELSKIPLGQVRGPLGKSSWTEGELRELVFAFLGFMSANNWSWLGNSSEIMVHEGLERLFGYLGFHYEHDLLERPTSSTAINLEPRRDIGRAIANLFTAARNEIFEEGMESHFSKEFVSLIKRHGEVAILEAAILITSEKADPDVASEALKWLGQVKHSGTHSFRIWLLKRGLTSSSPQVRDGAGLGLSFLNDPDAIPALQQAIEREQIPELRRDLEQVLQQLQHAP